MHIVDAEQAIQILTGKADAREIDSLTFGEGFSLKIRLPKGYHSEVPAQFLDAYHFEQQKLLRFVALIENGRADIKSLTSEQLEQYRFSVKVAEGSSLLEDNAADLLQRVASEAFSKMDGHQAMLTILGLAVIAGTTWGTLAYLQYRRQSRLEELASGERRAMVESFNAARTEDATTFKEIIALMKQGGDFSRRAADYAEDIQSARLRAVSQTNETEIDGVHITGAEAKELRSGSRRQASVVKVTKEMRVVDINTSDSANTTMILEDMADGDQVRVTYADRVLGAKIHPVVFTALQMRSTAMFTLQQRELDGEVVSVEISDVAEIDSSTG